MPDTHTHTYKHTLTRIQTYMHTFGYTTVVKHEAWILVNQLVRQTDEVFRLCSSCDFSKSLFAGSRCDWLILSKSCVCRGVAVAVRRSEEWHQSLLKLKDKNASSKHLKNFKILFYFFCLFFVVLFFFPPPAVLPPLNPPNSSVVRRLARDHVCLFVMLGRSVYSSYTWYSVNVCVYM